MKTTVHISDFKDFEGLQESCYYYSSYITEKGNTIITFENVNPFDKLQFVLLKQRIGKIVFTKLLFGRYPKVGTTFCGLAQCRISQT